MLGSGCNARSDVPCSARPVPRSSVELDGLITRRIWLEHVEQGYADMHAGKNIRGVLAIR